MELEIQHGFEDEQHFWDALEETLPAECDSHNDIDDALRSYLMLSTRCAEYIQTEDDIRRCAFHIWTSRLFKKHADYVRRQFVHCLLQEDETVILHIATILLLVDAREHEETFALLNKEGIFPRLVEMISAPRQDGDQELHRQFMELLYEMARIQKITNDDLTCVDDDFIIVLFNIIEEVSGNVEDPYHYPVIRVLLVLNEQFMVAAHDPTIMTHKATPLTNRVMKVLSTYGSRYKTFGENIILLLNREDETSLQLLTLKLLYLLFTTPPTYEYFYTNDLHVLVDILIRNLLDLPEEASALRHTYLRVLYPLLEHTQLKDPPHYKQIELRKLLSILAGDQVANGSDSPSFSHFEAVDDTTKRLVQRCQTVDWLKDPEEEIMEAQSPNLSDTSVPSPTKSKPPAPALPAPRKLRKRTASKSSGSGTEFLLPRLEPARQSSLSVAEMAVQREKPGVITPSRNPGVKHGLRIAVLQKKEKPPPPKARRSGIGRPKGQTRSESDVVRNESPTITGGEGSQAEDSPAVEINSTPWPEDKSEPRKPPPAPKARKWRTRKSKDADGDNPHDQGERQPDTTRLSIPASGQHAMIERSPFSTPEDKTLSPLTDHDDITAKKTRRISSVSAALEQAQAQALQDLEQALEKATIYEEDEGTTTHNGNASTRRAVLAPPSQAPRRDVPGPQIELKNNPVSEKEEDQTDIKTGADGDDRIEEDSEDEWN